MAASSSSSPFFGIRDDGGGGFFVHQMNQQQQQQQQQPPPQHHPQQLQTQPLVLQQQGNHLHLEHHRLLQQQQQQQQQPEQQSSSTTAPSSSTAGLPAPPPLKKRRNLPGTPNVDAEVIALSPKTLMATNRFLCEVCGKGFQREQNLQLHRRGHNLPWKLKQKNPADAARRRVYVCPEPTCAHHDPSRALGDLTGIKKHFCRKHGEKKWKCDKCSKRYAVHSDWKAHSKTCGTREYRCDCGTLFSRRDSFITHRAFCDALAQESGRHPVGLSSLGGHLYGGAAGSGNLTGMGLGLSQLMNSQHQPSSLHSGGHDGLLRLGGGAMTNQFGHLRSSSNSLLQQRPSSAGFFLGGTGGVQDYSDGGAGGVSQQSHNMFETKQQLSSLMQLPNLHGHNILGGNSQQSPSAQGETGLFNQAGFFSGNTTSNNQQGVQMMNLPHNFNPGSIEQHAGSPSASALPRLNLTNGGTGGHQGVPPGLFGSTGFHDYDAGLVPAAMSATALLQKAAQMGSSMSGGGGDGQQSSSLFRGFASPPHSGNTKPMQNTFSRDMQFTFGGNGDAVFLSPQTQLEGMESNHLQDLMNSLVGNGVAPMPSFSHGGNETFTPAGMKADTKLHQRGMQGGGGMGSSDGLTRDFLGVGGSGIIVGGGSVSSQEQMPASEQQRLMRQSREDDVNVGSLFDETKVANTASRSRSFANESI